MAIKVIRVLHEQSELNSFGINDNINVLLSEVPSNVKNSFYLYRLQPEFEIPEVGDRFTKNLQLIDSNSIIDFQFEIQNTVRGVELVINPTQPLIPAQKYALIVTSDIRKEGSITSGKTVSFGPGDIIVSTKAPLAGVEESEYTLKIMADSVITKKSNLVTATVMRKDKVAGAWGASVPLKTVKKDVFADTLLYSDNEITINVLSGGIPFLKDEEFSIHAVQYTNEQSTKIIAVLTANKSIAVAKPPVPSGRLTIQEFNKFYDALDRQQGGGTPTPDPTPVQGNAVNMEYRPPNKLIFKVDKFLDKNSVKYIEKDAGGNDVIKYKKIVQFDFDYAFGNYNLGSMGYYLEGYRYAIFQDVVGKNITFEFKELDVTSDEYTNAILIEANSKYHLLMRV